MVPARHGETGGDLRARRGIAEQAPVAQSTGVRQRIHRVAGASRCDRGVSDLAEIRTAMSGKRAIAVKTAARKRVGYREPRAATVPAAKMRVAEAVASTAEMAMASTTEMTAAKMATAVATTTMAATTMAAAAVTAAATSAESRAREQRRQDKDRNSNCRFGHGTLPAPRRGCRGALHRRQ
jgi:hypothetical protein